MSEDVEEYGNGAGEAGNDGGDGDEEEVHRVVQKVPKTGRRMDVEELYAWVDEIAGKEFNGWDGGAFRVRVVRRSPTFFRGFKTGGQLTESNSPIPMDEMQERFGGGEYQVSIVGPRAGNKPGFQVYAWSKSFSFPGEPNTDNLPKSKGSSGSNGEQDVTKTMTNKVVELVDKLQRKSEGGSSSSEILRIMQENMDRLTKSKDDELRSLREEMRGGGGGAAILGTVTQNAQSNIQMLITAHEATLRVKDEQHAREVASLRQDAERINREANERVERQREEFRREKEDYQRYTERDMGTRVEMLKSTAESEKRMLEHRIATLQSDLTVIRTELAAAKSRIEEAGDFTKQAQKLGALKETLGDLFGGGAEESNPISEMLGDDAPGWLRGLAGLANTSFGSKIGEGIATAFTNRAQSGQPLIPNRLPPSRRGPQPYVSPAVVPRLPVGEMGPPPLSAEELSQPLMPPPMPSQPPAAQLSLDGRIWPTLRAELEKVVEAGVPAALFVAEARKVIDPQVLQVLLQQSDDQILAQLMEGASPSSVLRMSGGQTYLREVLVALRGA